MAIDALSAERFARHHELFTPFFENERAIVRKLALLLYPFQRFLAEEIEIGANLPPNRGKGLASTFDRNWFTREYLKANPPDFAKERTGDALRETGEPLLYRVSLQWLQGQVFLLEDASTKSEKARLASVDKFEDAYITAFSYAVTLAAAGHLAKAAVKSCPLPSKEQLTLLRELRPLIDENERIRSLLVDENYGMVVEEAHRQAGANNGKLPLEELLAAGMLGLVEGINRYDPNRLSKSGEKSQGFAGCAAMWIRERIGRRIKYEGNTISIPVVPQVAEAEFKRSLNQGPELNSARLAAAETVLALYVRQNDPSIPAAPADAVKCMRQRHKDWQERVKRFAQAEIILETQRVRKLADKSERAKAIAAFDSDADACIVAARTRSDWAKKVVALADGQLKEVLDLPVTYGMDAEEGESIENTMHASVRVTPAALHELGDTTGILARGLSKLGAKQRLPLLLTFGMEGSKAAGAEYLADVLRRSHAATQTVLVRRGKKPLPRVNVADGLNPASAAAERGEE